ncbi:hypothetical protein [Edaphobacter sp.]|uniref:hypothetical protein n=1 Tax=Edaphobacter sp. TaxID=1934404 RepID=UPI002D7FB658|nr:hypothetical protein [Edaphobacter sp.]
MASLKKGNSGDEESAGGPRHEDDGVAVGSLGGRGCGGGIVAALGAALREGRDGA